MANKPYRRRIGQLLWIARSSRPDIAYQVNALARVAHNPGLAHWKASTLLMRYVAHTRHIGLVLRKDPSARLCLWSDATWAPDYGTFYEGYHGEDINQVMQTDSFSGEGIQLTRGVLNAYYTHCYTYCAGWASESQFQ